MQCQVPPGEPVSVCTVPAWP